MGGNGFPTTRGLCVVLKWVAVVEEGKWWER